MQSCLRFNYPEVKFQPYCTFNDVWYFFMRVHFSFAFNKIQDDDTLNSACLIVLLK